MPTINQLNQTYQLSPSDLLAIFSQSNGDARKASLQTVAAFFQTLQTAGNDKVTQYAQPNASGFTIQVAGDTDSVWMILTPTASVASGTIKMPARTGCIDGQELLVNCTQAISTLNFDGNGAFVTGAPTTIAANGFFRLRFDSVGGVWYRVG